MQNVSISIQISQLFLSVIRWQVSPCAWWALGFLCSGALSFKYRVANPFVKEHQRSSGFESSIYMSFTACTLKSFISHRRNIKTQILGFMKLLEVMLSQVLLYHIVKQLLCLEPDEHCSLNRSNSSDESLQVSSVGNNALTKVFGF